MGRLIAKAMHSMALCTAVAGIMSCAVNPATGKLDTVTVSEAKEKRIGAEEHEKILGSFPIFEDSALNNYVNEIGQKMAEISDRPELDYYFTVIDSPDINAFALPGGYIYINRGLINYLQNEAQLAAVLGHEIAHVTAKHYARRESAQVGRNIGAVLAGILTGSSTVASAAAQWSDAALIGYGRDMELEADSFGAQYLVRAGYSAEAMIDVLAILKDHERFSKQQARDAGKKPIYHHGVYSTHPKSDKRLQVAIKQASSDQEIGEGVLNVDRFREYTNGLIWGENYDRHAQAQAAAEAAAKEKENRYIHKRLGFTLVFPEAWTVANTKSSIVGSPQSKEADLTLSVARVDRNKDMETNLREFFKIDMLKQSEPLSQFGLIGHMGIDARDGTRLALLAHGSRGYLLQGKVNQPVEGVDYDALFINSIKSFQPVRPTRTVVRHSKVIKYVAANDNTTFARLAADLKLGNYGEEYLRLINGYYPRGEPSPGEVIKIIQ